MVVITDTHEVIQVDPHEDLRRISVKPFQKEFARQRVKYGLTLGEMAVRLGWYRTKSGGEAIDSARVARVLGLKASEPKNYVCYDNAVLLASALNKDPHELGV